MSKPKKPKRLQSPELFKRKGTTRVYQRRSCLFRFQLRLFCSLHRPVSLYSRLYHVLINLMVLFSCVIVNVFSERFAPYAFIIMGTIDILLTCLLSAEMILRLWSSECINDFKGFSGKVSYFKKYGIFRALDLLGIITFIAFIELHYVDPSFVIFLRLLHVLQIFQIYRLILPLLKLMISTIMVQLSQLYIATLFASIIFVLMSFSMHFTEMKNFEILNEAFWFTHITLTTIGFGDKAAETYWGKSLIICFASVGICVYQLPASIFGTGLAIKLKEEQKRAMFQFPAANLIQTYWRCYAADKDSKQKFVWSLYKKKSKITEVDKQCIRFILKYRYFRACRQFKSMTDPKRITDESQLQLNLLRKMTLIENTHNYLKDYTYVLKIRVDSIYSGFNELVQSLDEETENSTENLNSA